MNMKLQVTISYYFTTDLIKSQGIVYSYLFKFIHMYITFLTILYSIRVIITSNLSKKQNVKVMLIEQNIYI